MLPLPASAGHRVPGLAAAGAGKHVRRLVPSSSLQAWKQSQRQSRQPVPGPCHLDRCARPGQVPG